MTRPDIPSNDGNRRCDVSRVVHHEHEPHDWTEQPGGTVHSCDGRVSADDLTSGAGWRRPDVRRQADKGHREPPPGNEP